MAKCSEGMNNLIISHLNREAKFQGRDLRDAIADLETRLAAAEASDVPRY